MRTGRDIHSLGGSCIVSKRNNVVRWRIAFNGRSYDADTDARPGTIVEVQRYIDNGTWKLLLPSCVVLPDGI